MVAIDLENVRPGMPYRATPPVSGLQLTGIRLIVTSPLKVEASISTSLSAN
jgi:hypothetical protein